MSTVAEIEAAVRKLSREDLRAFRRWFDDFDAEAWDRQFEEDVKAGRLDALADEALRDLREGALHGPVKHRANPKFWSFYHELPEAIRKLADRNYELLKADPHHPSLHFKRVGRFWSAQIGIHYRAVAVQKGDDFVWFWIGHHSEYDRRLGIG